MKTLKTLSDYQLVQQYISGDQESFDELLRRHKNRVFTYIYLTVKNQELAEDIFQDTYIKVIKSLRAGKYQDNGRFLSWVMRIAHNLIIDHFRKEKQLNMKSYEVFDSSMLNSPALQDKNIEHLMIGQQINKDLRKLIDLLPDDQRQVIIMRHFMEMSFKEIADFGSISINTALGRMRYALINLRKLIEEKQLILVD